MDNIARRRAANTFTDASLLKVTYNVAALLASLLIQSVLSSRCARPSRAVLASAR